ncbi:hypothetical protein [Halomonas sp. HAL1]|uniref:hypothetical protein n=1 Tax=Halomonas sp. HAL1 TaxID=550984 RepID=UPI00022D3185|nr:hypothetical protein [Halomonas sp. HAL1]EHA16857.1 hypothetical protein HAL1_03752 [Halomonas sp. HAL1]WKV94603.1 hypothetical protein Q3Y66_08265 [Halomonas sp. HAL1]
MNAGALALRAAISISTNIIRGVATQSPAFQGLTIQDPIIHGRTILDLTMTGRTIPGQATTGQTIHSLVILATVIRVPTDMTNVLVGSVMV